MFERLVSGALAIAALAIAAVVVGREFIPVEAPGVAPPPRDHVSWMDWAADGIWAGDPSAPVVIGEFVDLQCIGCKAFHFGSLRPLEEEFGSAIAYVMIHFPLRSHPHSAAAGAAVECANEGHRFSHFVDEAFEKQDSVGVKSWTSYAQDAGVVDTVAFNACMLEEWPHERVARGRQIGDSLGIRATPTVMVNGRVYHQPPHRDTLFQIVRSILAVPSGS